MAEHNLLRKARTHVRGLIAARKPTWMKYHDFNHAKSVVHACKAIGAALNLDQESLDIVEIAAWFHDVGYLDGIDGHEERSADTATLFLSENGYPERNIALVAGCIRATKMPQDPKNLLEQVLCDADISHLARTDYVELSGRVRSEIEHRMRVKLTDLEWFSMNIDFVASHRYFTDYAKRRFEPQRKANLARLRKALSRVKAGAEV